MKPLLVIMLLINSFNTFCQDWALFPYQTDMYYFTEGTTNLFSCKHDSVSTIGDTINYLYNTHAPDGATQECFDSVINYEDNMFYSWPPYKMEFSGLGDSLTYYNNTYGSLPAIFKPMAAVGSSWKIYNNSDESEFSEIEISCDSIGLGNFLGFTDSLKYFSVHTVSPVTGAFTIDKATYILSKHYGLIRFLPFYQLINPTTCEDCFRCYNLIGWNAIAGSAGYKGPLWEDWIHLAPGDFLKYFYNYSNPLGTGSGFYTALIQNVTHYADSVVIQYENQLGYIYTYAYYKNALYNAISSPPWRPFYIPESPYQLELDKYIGEMYTVEQYIDTTSFPGIWRYKQYMTTIGRQSGDCFVEPTFEYSFEIGWDSYIGVTYRSSGSPKDYSYSGLAGYVINGQTYGNYSPLSINELYNNKNLINIFPNPAVDFIQFQIAANSYTQCFIYDITGKCHLTCQTISGKIDISGLPKGTYILNLISDTGNQMGKFVKL